MENYSAFMKKAGIEVLPQIHKALAEVEALLASEDEAIAESIKPILSETQRWASSPTNMLGYSELSAQLMRLSAHLSLRVIIKPKVFVAFRYTSEDEKIAEKFMELFEYENFIVLSARIAEARDIDEKARGMISEADGIIVIFTRESELKEGGWTTSTWLTDEKAFAIGKDKPPILFYEDCIAESQMKGIHGNLEYIKFNRERLDEAFLRAIPYLRSFRQRILTARS
jgi:hypothetical protein